jgi:hypothetical protein
LHDKIVAIMRLDKTGKLKIRPIGLAFVRRDEKVHHEKIDQK